MKEAQPVKKVMISDQKETDIRAVKMEGVKVLFACLRVAALMDPRGENFNPFRAVNDAKHIMAEAIGAKECSCQMCMCDVLAENSLLKREVH